MQQLDSRYSQQNSGASPFSSLNDTHYMHVYLKYCENIQRRLSVWIH